MTAHSVYLEAQNGMSELFFFEEAVVMFLLKHERKTAQAMAQIFMIPCE